MKLDPCLWAQKVRSEVDECPQGNLPLHQRRSETLAELKERSEIQASSSCLTTSQYAKVQPLPSSPEGAVGCIGMFQPEMAGHSQPRALASSHTRHWWRWVQVGLTMTDTVVALPAFPSSAQLPQDIEMIIPIFDCCRECYMTPINLLPGAKQHPPPLD